MKKVKGKKIQIQEKKKRILEKTIFKKQYFIWWQKKIRGGAYHFDIVLSIALKALSAFL